MANMFTVGQDFVYVAYHIAKAADADFNPGAWLTPCYLIVEEEDSETVAQLLTEAGAKFHVRSCL